MGRPLRTSLGGYVYHVLNRGNGRCTLFHKDAAYQVFKRILAAALQWRPTSTFCAYAATWNAIRCAPAW
jgi:putative transposase